MEANELTQRIRGEISDRPSKIQTPQKWTTYLIYPNNIVCSESVGSKGYANANVIGELRGE